MRIVGVDPSLTGTALWTSEANARCVTSRRGADRLATIRDLVLTYTVGADLVVLEGYSYASVNGAHQLGELGGVLRVALWEAGIPFVIAQPTVRAKYATGKGNAAKDAVVSNVSARTGIVFANNDLVDAYVLWAMGCAAYGISSQLNPSSEAHRMALESVEWPTLGCYQPVVSYKPPKKKTRKR